MWTALGQPSATRFCFDHDRRSATPGCASRHGSHPARRHQGAVPQRQRAAGEPYCIVSSVIPFEYSRTIDGGKVKTTEAVARDAATIDTAAVLEVLNPIWSTKHETAPCSTCR